jgi:hypothetical protein
MTIKTEILNINLDRQIVENIASQLNDANFNSTELDELEYRKKTGIHEVFTKHLVGVITGYKNREQFWKRHLKFNDEEIKTLNLKKKGRISSKTMDEHKKRINSMLRINLQIKNLLKLQKEVSREIHDLSSRLNSYTRKRFKNIKPKLLNQKSTAQEVLKETAEVVKEVAFDTSGNVIVVAPFGIATGAKVAVNQAPTLASKILPTTVSIIAKLIQ